MLMIFFLKNTKKNLFFLKNTDAASDMLELEITVM